MNKIIAFAVLSVMMASCGPVVKVKIQGTKDGVNVTTTQSASDSTSLKIDVNPTVNIH